MATIGRTDCPRTPINAITPHTGVTQQLTRIGLLSPTATPTPTISALRQIQRLFQRMCADVCDFMELSSDVKATASIYISRFYVDRSQALYPLECIMPAAILLASKVEEEEKRNSAEEIARTVLMLLKKADKMDTGNDSDDSDSSSDWGAPSFEIFASSNPEKLSSLQYFTEVVTCALKFHEMQTDHFIWTEHEFGVLKLRFAILEFERVLLLGLECKLICCHPIRAIRSLWTNLLLYSTKILNEKYKTGCLKQPILDLLNEIWQKASFFVEDCIQSDLPVLFTENDIAKVLLELAVHEVCSKHGLLSKEHTPSDTSKECKVGKQEVTRVIVEQLSDLFESRAKTVIRNAWFPWYQVCTKADNLDEMRATKSFLTRSYKKKLKTTKPKSKQVRGRRQLTKHESNSVKRKRLDL